MKILKKATDNIIHFTILMLITMTLTTANLAIKANTINSVCDGDWNNPNVWQGGVLPIAGDTIYVLNLLRLSSDLILDDNFVQVVVGSEVCGLHQIIVDNGSEVIVDGTLKVSHLDLYGPMVINGTLYINLLVGNNFLTMNGLLVIGWNGVCSPVVTVCIQPTPDFQLLDSIICEGECIDLMDASTSDPNAWNWQFTGANVPNSTSQNPSGICYSSAGSYDIKLIVSNSAGIDSITKSILVLSPLPIDTVQIMTCSNQPYFAGGSYQNSTGFYNDTVPIINGCDSIVVTELIVTPISQSHNYYSTCQGDSVMINGIYRKQPGLYYDTAQSITGCDSISISALIVYPVTQSYNYSSTCQGDSVIIYGIYRQDPGTYYDTLQTINGCDSIISTELIVIPISQSHEYSSMCPGDSSMIYGVYRQDPGTYYDTLQTINGCDSILSTTHTISQVQQSFLNVPFCIGDSVLVNGTFQSMPGIYCVTHQNVNGCDSIIFCTNLIERSPAHVDFPDFTTDSICENAVPIALPIGTPAGGTYSGLGVNGNNFDPSIAGIGTHLIVYSFESANDCKGQDTSTITVKACSGVSVEEYNNGAGIYTYPNPVLDLLYIEKTSNFSTQTDMQLFDISGKLIANYSMSIGQQKLTISVSSLNKGLYYLTTADRSFVKRLVKN